MLKIENVDVHGWEAAIRGMRNPMNSWERSDSNFSCKNCDDCYYQNENHREESPGVIDCWCEHTALRIGENDLDLMKRLAAGGSTHAKYRRMITVTLDIIAPLYWWKEFDTYKVGTVANSCSTMHKIHEKEFELGDFSTDRMTSARATQLMLDIIDELNENRKWFNVEKDPVIKKKYFNNMIQLLPTSYNQRRTVLLNYEVLSAIYHDRRKHKLDEWHTVCDWIETLPHSEIVTR